MQVNTAGRIAIAVACVFTLAACTSAGATGTVSQSPSENGIGTLPAKEILSQATANAKVQTSVHIRGDGSCADAGTFFADMKLRSDGTGSGTVKFAPYTIQVVSTPTAIYVKGSTSFWTSETSAKQAARIGAHWVRSVPSTNPCLQALGSFSNVLANYLGYPGTPTKQKSVSVYGVPAQLLSIPPDVSIWVQTRGVPLPVRIDETAAKTGISMGEWGAPVSVTVPAPSEVIDSSSIKAS